MNFERLDNLTSIGPDIDATIRVSRVAPSLFIKVGTGDLLLGEFFKNTLLLEFLGNISGVPEVHLLGRPSSESEVVSSLGPLDAHDGVFGALHMKELLLSLNVVDRNIVVVVLVDACDVAATGGDRN